MPPRFGDPKRQHPSSFSNGITGQCLCGGIKVTIKKNIFPKNGHMCHCSNCRKSSGSIASNNIVIDRDDVAIEDPKAMVKAYSDSDTGSSETTVRSFCSNCGSPICSIPTDDDTQYVLPLGIFPLILEPEFELFTAHKHDWEAHLDHTKKYKFMTSSGEI